MNKDRPDIIGPPPLAFLIALVAIWPLDQWLPIGILPDWPWWPGMALGALIVVFAVYTNISGFRAFQRAATPVNPYKPAMTVVRDGAFRYTRNPMYLGMILFVLGLGLMFSTLWGLLLSAILWAVLHYGVVLREERYMAARFKDDYVRLLDHTRRWL